MASAMPDLRLLPSRRASPHLTGTSLYCLVIDAHVWEQLA